MAIAGPVARASPRRARCWRRTAPPASSGSTPTQGGSDAQVNGYIATGRLKHNEPVPAAPRGRIPKDASPKQRVARKLRTKTGRTVYARRKVIPEPVFGQMKTLQGAGQLLLRGQDAARAEWMLHATVHNLRKLAAHRDQLPTDPPTPPRRPRSGRSNLLPDAGQALQRLVDAIAPAPALA